MSLKSLRVAGCDRDKSTGQKRGFSWLCNRNRACFMECASGCWRLQPPLRDVQDRPSYLLTVSH